VIRALSRPYATRWGAPVVDRVDPAIFVQRYFMQCMQCTYCFDSCCAYGVDVDGPNVDRIMAVADELEEFVDVPRERWFTGEWTDDGEFPGGRQTRTRVEDGACVFRNRAGRGCLIHSFALKRGTDYHELKPMVSVLFPLTFDYGLLHPSNEIEDKSLQCYGDGPTLYQGVRDEVGWYFGQALVDELDGFEREALAAAGGRAGSAAGGGDGLAGQPAAK
jgi:Fe-S-cluster containining protein